MEILVLVKAVPEAETRLRPNAAGAELDADGVKWVLAGYDESAVEQALLLKESVPESRVRAISFGPPARAEEVLRAALALGCDQATLVEPGPEPASDPVLTARALAAAARKYPFDLVLCGKQAGDDELAVVPAAVAALLELPGFGYVAELKADAGARRFTFQRVLEDRVESISQPWPCVIALQQAWNDPRTAKLQNILKSRKMPIDRVAWNESAAALGGRARPGSRPVRFRLPPPRTGAKMIDYKSPREAAEKLVRALREEAKVFP